MKKTTLSLLIISALLLTACSGGSQMNTAVFETNKGTIEIQLYPEQAPATVANFKQYVNDGFYNKTVFHRVIKDFMVQGGGFTVDRTQKAVRSPVEHEGNNGLKNDAGMVAMARTNDPNSATAQFFINTKDNNFLNYGVQGPGYTVFGKVTSGMAVVREIEASPTGTQEATIPTGQKVPMQDWPEEQIVIESAYLK